MAMSRFKISHFNSPLMTPLYFLIILFFLKLTHANYVSFRFSSFKPNCCCINYEGNAGVSRKAIHLTIDELNKSATGSVGRATYCEPIHLWDKTSGNLSDFYTTFSFAIDSQLLQDYADGLAFFLSAVNFPFLNKAGGGLGLARENTKSRYPFVAIEFDTYSNSWDPTYNHVGVNINSVVSNATTKWLSRVRYGSRISVSIKYDSTLKSLTVTFTGFSGSEKIQQNLVYAIDLRAYLPEWVKIGFSAATGSSFEKHILYSWQFTSNLQVNDYPIDDIAPTANPPIINDPRAHASTDRANKGAGLVVGITAGGCIFVGIILFLLFFFWWNKRGREKRDDENGYDFSIDDFEKTAGPRKFSYSDLVRATNSFSEEEKLGKGGSGTVYRGFLKELATYVAVKRISAGCSKQGIREYSSEIRIISQLRHRNLVQLLGWCHERKELLLVYELMPNGSLDCHLFKNDRFLTWEMRYNIAQGLASGLLYLQEEWQQLVVHRDIKSSNIMLDSKFNAKLGDFGLARLVDHGKGSQTTMLAGTLGYMAPECVITGKASKESDVYSFGIVALEIACGRKSIDLVGGEDQTYLVQWVWDLYGGGKLLEAVDPRLNGVFDQQQLARLVTVGLWCAHPYAKVRPSIRHVIQVLNFGTSLPVLPSKIPVPAYLAPAVNTSTLSFSLSATISKREPKEPIL